MEETEFNAQVRSFVSELTWAFEYVDISEVYEAKMRMYSANEIIDEDIPIFINYASYIGSLFRISYYKYVHKRGYDVRALADASVLTLMFSGVYRFEFEPYLRSKEVSDVIKGTRWPAWTRIGLVGGSTSDIVKNGQIFVDYMNELIRAEESADDTNGI